MLNVNHFFAMIQDFLAIKFVQVFFASDCDSLWRLLRCCNHHFLCRGALSRIHSYFSASKPHSAVAISATAPEAPFMSAISVFLRRARDDGPSVGVAAIANGPGCVFLHISFRNYLRIAERKFLEKDERLAGFNLITVWHENYVKWHVDRSAPSKSPLPQKI